MPQSHYFQITLEPHLKRSGLETGRKILFLPEVPVDLAKADSEAPEDDRIVAPLILKPTALLLSIFVQSSSAIIMKD